MKLQRSLDRACDLRLQAAARTRSSLLLCGALLALAIVGLPAGAMAAQSLAHPEAIAETQAPAVMLGSALLGGAVLTGLIREEAKDPEAGGGAGGGGGGEKADDTRLSIGQRLSAALASKTDLQAKIASRDKTITEHAAEIDRLTKAHADLQAQLDQANAKITRLEADAAEVDKALKQAEAEAAAEKAKNSTVDKKAQEKIASLGFPAGKLPAAQESDPNAGDDVPVSEAELEKALAGKKTHREKADLIAKFKAAKSLN